MLHLYDDIRPQLVTGHLVTFDGGSLLSRAIKHFAPGGSHTAMVLRLSDCPKIVFLFEALARGPEMTVMSSRISNYHGQVVLGMHEVSPAQQRELAELALLIKAKKLRYDYLSLVRQMWRRVRMSLAEPFCSELVQYLYTKVKLVPPEVKAKTPGELRTTVGHEVVLAPYTAVPNF